MNCAICGRSMDESSDNRFKRWTCPKCGWSIRVPMWMAMKFYWEHDRPIDNEITFGIAAYEMEYNTPTIRSVREHIGADIGDFITAKLDDGESYQILIKIIKKMHVLPTKEPLPPCKEICADPDLIVVANNGYSKDDKATLDRQRLEWKRILECPLRDKYACPHVVPDEFR